MFTLITNQGLFIQLWASFNHVLLCKYFGLLLRLSPSRNVTKTLLWQSSSKDSTFFLFYAFLHGLTSTSNEIQYMKSLNSCLSHCKILSNYQFLYEKDATIRLYPGTNDDVIARPD